MKRILATFISVMLFVFCLFAQSTSVPYDTLTPNPSVIANMPNDTVVDLDEHPLTEEDITEFTALPASDPAPMLEEILGVDAETLTAPVDYLYKIGLIIQTVVLIVLLIIIFVMYLQYRKENRKIKAEIAGLEPLTPDERLLDLYLQQADCAWITSKYAPHNPRRWDEVKNGAIFFAVGLVICIYTDFGFFSIPGIIFAVVGLFKAAAGYLNNRDAERYFKLKAIRDAARQAAAENAEQERIARSVPPELPKE